MLLTAKIGSVLMSDEVMRREVIKGVRRWAQAWETQKRVMVVVNLITVPKASRSAVDINNSSGKWAKGKRSDCVCSCDSIHAAGMWR